jgi:hypothetical protein
MRAGRGSIRGAEALVVLLVVVIALVVADSRSVKVSWVFGSTHQSLVWIRETTRSDRDAAAGRTRALLRNASV